MYTHVFLSSSWVTTTSCTCLKHMFEVAIITCQFTLSTFICVYM